MKGPLKLGSGMDAVGRLAVFFVVLFSCSCGGPILPQPEPYVHTRKVVEIESGGHRYLVRPSETLGRMLVSMDGGDQRVEIPLPGPAMEIDDVKVSPWVYEWGIAMAVRGRSEDGRKHTYYWATVVMGSTGRLEMAGACAFLKEQTDKLHIERLWCPESDSIHILLSRVRLGAHRDPEGPSGLLYANVCPGSGPEDLGYVYELKSTLPID